MAPDSFDSLAAAAEAVPLEGWDFGWLTGRIEAEDPSWSYVELARPLVARSTTLLDIDTGGGELLASMAPLPQRTVATESWPPNLMRACDRLAAPAVTVVAAECERLPVRDECVDLVLNRHGLLHAGEVSRPLQAGGTLLTQQVGSDDCAKLNEILGAPPRQAGDWTLAVAVDALSAAGLDVLDAREEHPVLRFLDIAAVVFQLRMVAWQVPDFSVTRYRAGLQRIHAHIQTYGGLDVDTHRFLIRATKRAPGARYREPGRA